MPLDVLLPPVWKRFTPNDSMDLAASTQAVCQEDRSLIHHTDSVVVDDRFQPVGFSL